MAAARQLRDMGVLCPILSLSADVFEEPAKQLSDLFTLTMTKPFSRQQLLEALAHMQSGDLTRETLQISADNGSSTLKETDDELLQEYRRSLPSHAETIQRLMNTQELDKLNRLLHQIKGTTACFGLDDISALAAAAHGALKAGTLDEELLGELTDKLYTAAQQ